MSRLALLAALPLALAEDQQLASALRFAQRRRIGPYAEAAGDLAARQKALAAMLRAGHPMDLARKVVGTAPGDVEGLADDA